MNGLGSLVEQGTEKCCEAIQDSMVGNLERKRLRLESQLQDTNAALDALKSNPDVARVLELVLKAR
jgi:hypothetical protein